MRRSLLDQFHYARRRHTLFHHHLQVFPVAFLHVVVDGRGARHHAHYRAAFVEHRRAAGALRRIEAERVREPGWLGKLFTRA